jgi:hypothetical protein
MYKNILMDCSDKRRLQNLLVTAVNLPETFQANLTALSVVPPVSIVARYPRGLRGGPFAGVDSRCYGGMTMRARPPRPIP